MKQRLNIAFTTRINALLCCSAAVLLAACGGTDGASGLPTQTAAVMQTNVDASAANATEPNAADAAAAATAATTADFSLKGYDSHPLSASAGSSPEAVSGQGAPGSSAAPADGSPRLLAMVTSVPPTDTTASTTATALSTQLTTPATTHNYYVSPTGNDSAAGTQSAPFKTLARAARAATSASTTVWVAPGTYAGNIQTTASGTSSGRIYWVSTTKWGAKVVPPSSSTKSVAWDNRGNYVSIIGFDIDGTNAGSGTKWAQGLYIGGSYGMIANNHVHNIAQNIGCTSGGGSAIGVDSYYHGVMDDIQSNVVHDIGPAGCSYVQGIYVSTSGTIRNNLVYRVAAVAIHLWHDATNVIITNNTATSSDFGMVVGGGDFYFTTAGANNVFVANNIIYDNHYGISEQGKTGTANQYKNNLVYKNTSYNISLRNGLVATGTVSSDPLFKAYSRTATTPDFHLSSSSPAIGRGIATNALTTDLDGRPRNSTTGYDIGAYQH